MGDLTWFITPGYISDAVLDEELRTLLRQRFSDATEIITVKRSGKFYWNIDAGAYGGVEMQLTHCRVSFNPSPEIYSDYLTYVLRTHLALAQDADLCYSEATNRAFRPDPTRWRSVIEYLHAIKNFDMFYIAELPTCLW